MKLEVGERVGELGQWLAALQGDLPPPAAAPPPPQPGTEELKEEVHRLRRQLAQVPSQGDSRSWVVERRLVSVGRREWSPEAGESCQACAGPSTGDPVA